MKLLIDVCLTPEWVSYFGERQIEAIHWSSIGAVDAEDALIFQYARDEGCVVFTHDLDFGALLAHSRTHSPSVIQARVNDPTPDFLGPAVMEVLGQFAGQLSLGAIVTILPDRAKVRILPI